MLRGLGNIVYKIVKHMYICNCSGSIENINKNAPNDPPHFASLGKPLGPGVGPRSSLGEIDERRGPGGMGERRGPRGGAMFG